MKFSLRVGPPIQGGGPTLPPMRLDSQRIAIQLETAYPGGVSAITVTLPQDGTQDTMALLARFAEFPHNAHVRLMAGVTTIAEGRLTKYKRGAAGEIIGFVATGYALCALQDLPLFSTDSTARSAGSIAAYVVANRAPALRLGSITDPGARTSHSLSEFDGKFPAEILDQLSKEGNGNGTIWDVYVSPGASSGLDQRPVFNWLPRTPPTSPSYNIVGGWSGWDEDMADMRGEVWVNYGSGSGSRVAISPNLLFPGQNGFQRGIVLPAGNLSQQAATNFGYAYQTIHSQPVYAIDFDQRVDQNGRVEDLPGLRLASGQQARPWLSHAGEWARFPGVEQFQLCTRTTFDTDGAAFTAKFGEGWSDATDAWADTTKNANAYRRGVNAISGAKN